MKSFLCGMVLIGCGILSTMIEGDATAAIFLIPMGALMSMGEMRFYD